MSEQGHRAHVKVYPNRLAALRFCIGSVAFCTLGVWMLVDLSRPPTMTHPWMYEEPGRTIAAVSVLILSGSLTLLSLYWLVTPLPMFKLDSAGITYRVTSLRAPPLPPVTWGSVRWQDIRRITAYKQKDDFAHGGTRLELTIKLTHRAIVAHGYKPTVELTVSQWLLPISIEEFVHDIQEHHSVTLIGGPWRDLH